ncbi:N-acetylglucosamine-6-phosphate deacetylase [Corynebacterium anserum]|uniref:N-acetylglucosamine-6-phosphate deacetylase n=1 Tax=Corynebacterium anserum TaxID=2684406 RepID=A0A7G7YQJ9_9CORY|nr:N-acetylglucosamine-6-phosphate deacetylase [Corynebacterium anserum]QNH96769.1 N-acetylglucosamine-6-phosphate deacetylase [Corynebacterium anserum]
MTSTGADTNATGNGGTVNNAEPQCPHTSVFFDPIMVVAVARNADMTSNSSASDSDSDTGPIDPEKTVVVWQVETDPAVTLGDFSGAWVVTEEGIQGFAANADWIDERHDQAKVLATLLRYPVLPAEGTSVKDIRALIGDNDAVQIIDKTATEEAARVAIEDAKKEFARLQPDKKQPSWGQIDNMAPVSGHSAEGHDKATTSAINAALASARGLRAWLRAWQAFDKTRIRRLGKGDSAHLEPRPVPLVEVRHKERYRSL